MINMRLRVIYESFKYTKYYPSEANKIYNDKLLKSMLSLI